MIQKIITYIGKLSCLFVTCCIFNTNSLNAQILSYTNNTTGALNAVAPNASGTALTLVNGATLPSSPCGSGYTSQNYTSALSYSTTLPGVQTSATANTGYMLNVTGFSVDLRRSGSGPANVRFAYSTDGGTTWIDQGADQNPNNSTSCSTTITATWSTSFTVGSSIPVLFCVYGFNASGTGGHLLIQNLIIDGTVTVSSSGCGVASGLSTASITTTSATLSWGAVAGATSYNIQYRQTGTTTWSTTTAAGASVNLTGLTCGTTYEFQVQAVCASGSSAFTASTTFTTSACTSSCAMATGLSATGITTTAATLNWAAATGATGYNIQYRQTGTSTWSTATSAGTATTVNLTGLTCGTTYEFQVQTVCSTGTSAFTASTTFTTSACVSICAMATALYATSIATTGATLTWVAASGATSYNIQYRQTGTLAWSSTTATGTSVNVTGLTCGTSYEFQVQTVCSAGTGLFTGSTTFTTLACSSSGSGTGNHIATYFNFPVNTAVSTGVNAVYLSAAHGFEDTMVAYVNRSQYSLDIAVYDFYSTLTTLVSAINSAYARGVVVRIILDGSETTAGVNTVIGALTSGIPVVNSPTASYYIMHDKMMIIDAGASDPSMAVVCLTSADYSGGMVYASSSYNNMVFIQDSSFAHVCTDEFNSMWGSTTATPGSGTFSTSKPHVRKHIFTIDGKTVELYFSPKDTVNKHVLSSISSANTDLYVGMFTFTQNPNADSMIARQTAGVYVSAIIDQGSAGGTAYTTVSSGLGANFKEYTGSYRYHNKFMIVDPSNPCSDPQVLTGSYNWTSQANTSNDEDYIIIHSDTIANIYYQSYNHNFSDLGGTLTSITPPCTTSSCPMPTYVEVTSTTSSAVVTWATVTGASSYVIQYRMYGTTTWTTITSATTSVTLTGLTGSALYEVEVQAVCSTTSSSVNSEINTFPTTGPTAITTIAPPMTDANNISIYPNPTNNIVTLSYSLSTGDNVNIEVYNIMGQKIATVLRNEIQSAGNFSYNISLPASGVYFVKFSTGNYSVTRKIERI